MYGHERWPNAYHLPHLQSLLRAIFVQGVGQAEDLGTSVVWS